MLRSSPTGGSWKSHARRAALFLVIATRLLAQSEAPLRVDPKRLPLQVDTFAIYMISGRDTTLTGTLVDALRSEGRRLIRVYSQKDRVVGPQLDTIISNLPDLSPSAYRTKSPAAIIDVTYKPMSVVGWRRLPNGDSVSVKVALPKVIYDGASYDLVVRASPLSERFALTVPAFVAGSGTVAAIAGRVTGTDVVDGHDCWVFLGNFTGMPVTFWIDKDTRALRRQLLQPRVDLSILFTAPRPIKRASQHG